MLTPQIFQAAEHALADMALRAVFAREIGSNPEVNAMEWRVSHDSPGLVCIDLTCFDRAGVPIGGGAF